MNRAILFSLLAVVLVGIVAIVWFRNSSEGLADITFTLPESILVGVPFDARVGIINTSSSVLNRSKLTVFLPEGVVFVGSPESKTSMIKDLGTIGSGGVTDETLRLMVLRGENTFKRLSAQLSYVVGSSSSLYEREGSVDMSIGGIAISLDIGTPLKVLNNEEFDIALTYENTSRTDIDTLSIRMLYPPSFTLLRSTPAPDRLNREWDLGGLRGGSKGAITLHGLMVGSDNALADFSVELVGTFGNQTYVIGRRSATLTISPSPLSLSITLNDAPGYISKLDDTLRYTLRYTNSTDTALRDVIIKVNLVGAMFDPTRLSSRGTYRSLDNSITWNAATTPELALLGPGASGSVDFTISTLRDYPIRRPGDKNFTLRINASIESPTVPQDVAASKTIGIASHEAKVSGKIDVQALAFYRDAGAGVINSGPWPPKVDQPTQFTIHWRLKNYSTEAKDITVRAFLGGNTKFLSVVKNSTQFTPTYNDRTQEIVWSVPALSATRGVIDTPPEVIFQIEAIPPSSFVGSPLPLIQVTELTATDSFTGIPLRSVDEAITTSLPDDATVQGQGNVRP